MQQALLSGVSQFVVPTTVVQETLLSLQHYGASHCEGLVLWLGRIDDGRAIVVQSLTPPQKSISSEDGVGYFVEGETLFQLNVSLLETGLRLLAQVHSHPGRAYHSSTDDRYAIVTADGGLSLVVPDFGRAPPDPRRWAVYRLDRTRWREVKSTELKSLLFVDVTL
jgi:hypothetical protein